MKRPDPDKLLSHRGFVRGLALRLVSDKTAADDVVQETWLAAMQNAPARPRSLRAWLARVTRNLALRATRSDLRRRHRERRAARPESTEGAGDVVARLAEERRVVDAVMGLEEPYRTTVLLRFYDDLKPKEIATRLGVNSTTVRTRLKRGLDALRARLDADHDGDRRAWMLALIPLLVPSKAFAAPAASGGILLMSSKSKVAAAVGVLLVAMLGVGYLAVHDTPRPTQEHTRAAVPETPGRGTADLSERKEPDRPPPGSTAALSVRVVDHVDRPVAGAQVKCLRTAHVHYGVPYFNIFERDRVGAPLPVVARRITDAVGRAAFDCPLDGTYKFRASKEGLATGGSRAYEVRDDADAREIVIRLDRAYRLSGRVVDSKGTPWAGAAVLAAQPGFSWNQRQTDDPSRTLTAADGSFEFTRLPPRDVSLWVSLPGGVPFHVYTLRFPSVSEYTVVIDRGGVLRGRVTDADTAAPLAGARVHVMGYFQHRAAAVTDDDGRYVVDTLPATQLNQITVTADGYYDVRDRDVARPLQLPLGPGDEVVRDVTMRHAIRVSGRVAGPDGALADTIVHAQRPGGPWVGDHARTRTDRDGRYVLFLRPQRHQLQIATRVLSFPNWRYFNDLEEASGNEAWIIDVPDRGELIHDVALVLNPMIFGDGVVNGRVESAAGEPLSGVRLWGNFLQAVSGNDGNFVLMRVAASNPKLFAQKAGWRKRGPVDLLGDSVVVVLEKAPGVAGNVSGENTEGPYVLLAAWPRDKNSWPKSAKSQAWARMWYDARRVSVANDGSYRVDDMADDARYFLRAGALNKALSSLREIRPGVDRYDFVLVSGGAISGRVVARVGGAPLGGAVVKMKSLSEKNPWPSTQFDSVDHTVVAVADDDGRFRVDHIDGVFRVRAEAPGYLPAESNSVRAGRDGIVLALARNLTIEGFVVFEDGSPAVGLKVRVDHEGAAAPKWATALSSPMPMGTSSTGRFRVSELEARTYSVTVGGRDAITRTVSGVAAGGRDVHIVVARAAPGEGEEWPIPVRGAGEISGRVTTPAGKPLAGYRVWANIEGKAKKSLGKQTGTRKDGRFTVRGLAEGTYHVRCTAPGGLMMAGRTGVRVGASDLAFIFDSIGGVIVQDNGTPLVGRRILARAIKGPRGSVRVTRSDSSGRFRIDGLVPGRYRIEVRREIDQPNVRIEPAATYPAGRLDLRLVATLGAKISGVVTDDRGAPLREAWVSATADGKALLAKTDANGRFEVAGLVERTVYTVEARRPGLVSFRQEGVMAGRRNLSIVLKTGFKATGTVVDEAGKPLARSSLRYVHLETKASGLANADDKGKFELIGLAEGKYRVLVYRVVDRALKWVKCGTIEARARNVELRVER